MEAAVQQQQAQLGEVTAELNRLRQTQATTAESAVGMVTVAAAGMAAQTRAEDLTKLGKPKTFSPGEDFEEWD